MKHLVARFSEPVVWAVLLIGALGFAYQTWTREPEEVRFATATDIWRERPEAVASALYEAENRTTLVEWKDSPAGPYLWAVVVRPRRTYSNPAQPADSTSESAEPPLDTVRFVVGADGENLIEDLAAPMALRGLGVLEEDALGQYGLAEPKEKLTVNFRNGTSRVLMIGDAIYSSSARYVLDTETGRSYVLSGELYGRMSEPEYHLPENRLHAFTATDIDYVVLRAGGRERTMNRKDGVIEGTNNWVSPDAPDRAEPDFDTFMDRLGRLWVTEYLPDVDLMQYESVLGLDYYDPRGNLIGYLEIRKRPGEDSEPEYLFATELTRIAARPYGTVVDEIVADLDKLF